MRFSLAFVLLCVFALPGCTVSKPLPSRNCVLPIGCSDPEPLERRIAFILPTGEHVASSCTPFWLIRTTPIQYPEGARKARMQGIVIINGLLSEQGEVQQVLVVRGLNPLLDNAVLRGVRQWVFVPTGQPLLTRSFEATIRFALN